MLECHSHHEADSVLVYARIVVVVKAADVFHMYEFEYVMNAEGEFVVWSLGVHDTTTGREHHEHVALGVLFEERVVFVRE